MPPEGGCADVVVVVVDVAGGVGGAVVVVDADGAEVADGCAVVDVMV
jgi:hypothetical protein